MIQMYHVSKKYGRDSSALSDISLEVAKGEFVFLTGPSGAGKTTLLKLIFREEHPTHGQILVNSRNISRIPDSQVPYLRRTIGVVFQDFKLLHNKTVLENVSFVHKILGAGKKERRSIAYKVLKMVGLQHKVNSYPLQLSGGEQQRIAIARALANDPVLLLADEPTGNLDPEMAQEIIDLFKNINAQGTTIVLATHDRGMIDRNPKRVIALHGGILIDDGLK